MIVTIRLEAEGKTMAEVLDDITEMSMKLSPTSADLHIFDEHYERVHDTCFKGRRVFRHCPKLTPIRLTSGNDSTFHFKSTTTARA